MRKPPATTPYGPVAAVYDAFLTFTGFKRGVERFLNRVDFAVPNNGRILDAGCGTGLLSFYFARRFPTARVVATDIDPAMLRELAELRDKQKLPVERLRIGESDLGNPAVVRFLNASQSTMLPHRSFDAIVVSGALEHVALNAAVARLAGLLKPGGTFFNLGMRRSPVGAALGMIYRYRPYRIADMRNAAINAGLSDVRVIRLGAEDFPANLSRVAMLARKAAPLR
ncbi:MAG: hypothetical protein A3A44_01980 [Candidatus Sungbacteria bacterium RIFCSPLOWO2_01_FULL_60_25]|uniref:Methyltransferase type 12 domain-containing protein n=1 Tax=Candidatus Sungbacteria bacterium RIFCSPLOWO2_01_FULL_60_25 TaxID=1802281 RepID=A0A1G2LD16_9BACT|nr:MAG: hypothetical protein A3A44_01980 [Candidatus Sungbacteria bacterium RIFCSPLOWO2_01_FULL_60_25]